MAEVNFVKPDGSLGWWCKRCMSEHTKGDAVRCAQRRRVQWFGVTANVIEGEHFEDTPAHSEAP